MAKPRKVAIGGPPPHVFTAQELCDRIAEVRPVPGNLKVTSAQLATLLGYVDQLTVLLDPRAIDEMKREKEAQSAEINRLLAHNTDLRERNLRLTRDTQALRAQNVEFRSAAKVLVDTLHDAWWLDAAEAYQRMKIQLNDEIQ